MHLPFETLPQHWVNRLSFLLRKSLADGFRAAGANVTAEEWAVLLMLWQQDNRNPGELADLTIRDRTTMTRLLDGMERKGLISRATDPKDRRRMIVTLTDRGREMQVILVPIAKDLIADCNDDIPPKDIEITMKTLRQMSENIQRKRIS